MNYEDYKGEIGVFQDAIGQYVGGEILSIDGEYAYIEGMNISAHVPLSEVFLLATPAEQAELGELRKRVETLKGQRDMCFRKLQRAQDDIAER